MPFISYECTSWDDFNTRFAAAQHIEGFGMDTTMHVPCAFCAAPDFMIYPLLELQTITSRIHICKACGRAGKFLYQPLPQGGTQMELVQTGGPNPPAWMTPAPRRVEV